MNRKRRRISTVLMTRISTVLMTASPRQV